MAKNDNIPNGHAYGKDHPKKKDTTTTTLPPLPACGKFKFKAKIFGK